MKNLSRFVPVLFTFTAALLATAGAQTIVQDFNAGGGGTFLTNWSQNGPNAANFFQNTAGGGIGNSNAVDLTSNTGDATAIFRATPFDLSTGTPTVSVSGYFRNQTPGGGSAVGAFQIGFGSDPGDGANTTNTGTAFNGAGVYSPDSTKTFLTARLRGNGAVEFQSGLTGVTTNSAASAAATLVSGNLYFLSASFTRSLTVNTFSGSVSLFDSDASGTVGTLLATLSSATLTNSAIWTDSTTYAGFRAAGQTSGANGANLVDNFSASLVPEPTVFALAALGLAGCARRRRSV